MARAKAAASDPLAPYRAKRDFTRTAEPTGGAASASGRRFVVQKHAATRLHWDFRLELDGVLVSWAVTRGPSADPREKRLAVRTEDHPIDYAAFEGVIPKGEYGGGTVMLWDEGEWTPAPGKDPRATLKEGHLHFTLDGARMRGEWILVRLKPRGKERRENWLLRKVADDFAGGADDLVGAHLTGVRSGRTMDEIAAGAPPVAKKAGRSRKAAPPGHPPPFRPPQLATLAESVPAGDQWLHEIKHDGYRILLSVGGGQARAYTRSGLDWSDKFPGLVREAAGLDVRSALIDGEAVVAAPDGRSDFGALQAALKAGGEGVVHQAFDLLEHDGEDLTRLPLTTRKARLAAILEAARAKARAEGRGRGLLLYGDHLLGQGGRLWEEACAKGLEGIVSKRADSPHVGARDGAWLKIKCVKRQEFVVVGWLPSAGGRGLRSLLLGVHEGGGLRYAGKVGTGFGREEAARLLERLGGLASETATVAAPRAAVRGARWVRPALVVEVAYAEVTGEGVLRHSSYLGLREDKRAEAVVREIARPAPSAARDEDAGPAGGVVITHPERVVDPDRGLTKADLARHVARMADAMLEWAANRPLSLVRCPQGRAKACFFQKHDAGGFGAGVRQVAIAEKDGGREPNLFVDDVTGLMTCVQMGTVEFHGWGARIEDVERPDRLVFDLDPDEGLDFGAVKAAAAHLRELLAGMGLVTFAMTTGGKGVHVIAPLTPEAEWAAVKDFARRFSLALEQSEPERFTAALAKAKRKGRIFIDHLRNQRGATAVMPFSPRARPGMPVAAPVTWEELRDLDTAARWKVGDAEALLERARSRDLAGWGRADQTLPDL